MATEPWSGARYQASSDAPNGYTLGQNLAFDLGKFSAPAFASTAARDTAFSNWQAAGNSPFSGMRAFTAADGRFWSYDTGSSSWLYAGGKPPPIVTCSAGAGWSINTSRPVGVYKDASGLIHVVGDIKPNSTYAPGDGGTHTMLTLPSGYRPASGGSAVFVAVVGSPVNLHVTCSIDSTGLVSVIGSSNNSGATTIASGANHSLDQAVFHPGYANSLPYA